MTTELEQRIRVVEEARGWLRTPYHHQGRVKGVGVDCAMILCEVYQAAGLIPYIDPRPYPMDWHLHRSEERYLGWLEQYAHRIEEVEVKPGDVVVWRFGKTFSHGAIYIGGGEIIHSYRQVGCELASIDDGRFGKRERAFYSMWGN